MKDNSGITVTDSGTIHTGDATLLYHYAGVVCALEACNRGMMLTRGASSKVCLLKATNITKKPYPNNRKGRDAAIADIKVTIAALKAALPATKDERTKP